jgi:hypothetical protein
LFKEALIKSTYTDLRQKFLLARKKTAGILRATPHKDNNQMTVQITTKVRQLKLIAAL